MELFGRNFAGAMTVTFGGVPAPFVFNSDVSITTYVPIRLNVGEADRRVSISVSTEGESGSAGDFTVLAPKVAGTSFFGISGLVPGRGRAGDKVLKLRRGTGPTGQGGVCRYLRKCYVQVSQLRRGYGTSRGGERHRECTGDGPQRYAAHRHATGHRWCGLHHRYKPGPTSHRWFHSPVRSSGTRVSIRGVNFTFMGNPNVRRVQFGSGNAAFTVVSATERSRLRSPIPVDRARPHHCLSRLRGHNCHQWYRLHHTASGHPFSESEGI